MHCKILSLILIFFNILQGGEEYVSKNSAKLLKITIPDYMLIQDYKYWAPKIIENLTIYPTTKDNLLIKAILNNDIEEIQKNILIYDLRSFFVSKAKFNTFNMYVGHTYLSLALLVAANNKDYKLLETQIKIIKLLLDLGFNSNYIIGRQYYCGDELDCESYFTIMKFAYEIDSHNQIIDLLIESGGIIPNNTFH